MYLDSFFAPEWQSVMWHIRGWKCFKWLYTGVSGISTLTEITFVHLDLSVLTSQKLKLKFERCGVGWETAVQFSRNVRLQSDFDL